ncbi:phospholipid carrier-dependent glycosyltransferase [Candidatus Peribacteria bacterium]|nr:phospholipid carrier-dependent glycosyltransferase [Candidatus Peribacteria bacterium]
MLKRYSYWLPEFGLAVVALFFTYRELGISPGTWIDEGLFIMTAKMVVAGKGYAIPLLDHVWYYPYFLAVGPTVILPTALSLKLFGLSVAAARFPMTLYVLGSAAAVYVFTRKVAGLSTARWTTALLVSLSAFINTGKPVLGEIPAFFFLMLGLLAMASIDQKRAFPPAGRGAVSGIFFGISILTKLTFGLILPALAVSWVIALARKQWKEVTALTVSGIVAVLVYLPWRFIEATHTPAGSLTEEVDKFIFGGGDMPILYVLRENNEILTRIPFVAFGIILVLGMVGLWSSSTKLSSSIKTALTTLVALFTLYFLNSYGWYRHLVPAHLLLLPFVPGGMSIIIRSTLRLASPALAKSYTSLLAMVAMGFIVLWQADWQIEHRGSGFGTASAMAAKILQEKYRDTDLLIEESELFAQLPENPHWLYLVRDRVSPSMPEIYRIPNPQQRCFQHVRKLSYEELEEYGDTALAMGSYHLLPRPVNCR